ncbi:pyridoxamine 5'-phosphate oxidase family protein [Mesorhizobium sp. M0589]|uniref:pyridoxamine 5'-phosphate oxidase family protein n=1 Tax=Mesorhizobium sp. M0589 TaxID=2956965 RepID=UPI00333B9973
MANLATVTPDGAPRNAPMWFIWEDAAIWLLGSTGASAVKHLERDPRCAVEIVHFDNEAGILLHLGLRGVATIEAMAPNRFKRPLHKYPVLCSKRTKGRAVIARAAVAALSLLVASLARAEAHVVVSDVHYIAKSGPVFAMENVLVLDDAKDPKLELAIDQIGDRVPSNFYPVWFVGVVGSDCRKEGHVRANGPATVDSDDGSEVLRLVKWRRSQFPFHIDADVLRGRLSSIFEGDLNTDVRFGLVGYHRVEMKNGEIGAQLRSRRAYSDYGVPSPDKERNNRNYRPNDGEPDLGPCRYLLPLSGCRASLSGISGPALGIQIGSLVIVGLLFTFGGVGGLFWSFQNGDRKSVATGIGNAAICGFGLFFFYCWAFLGHPLGFLRAYVGG